MLIIELLKKNGIDIYDGSVPAVVGFSLIIFIISVICFMTFLNIIFYFVVLLNKENKIILNIIEKHWILTKLFNFYCNISKFFLITEILIFLFGIGLIIYLNFKIVNAYFQIINF